MSALSLAQILQLIEQRSPQSRTAILIMPENYGRGRNLDEMTPAGVLRALGHVSFTDLSNTSGSLNLPMPNIPDFMQDRVAQWQGWPRPDPLDVREIHLEELRGGGRTQNPPWPCWTCRHSRIADFLDSGTVNAQSEERMLPELGNEAPDGVGPND